MVYTKKCLLVIIILLIGITNQSLSQEYKINLNKYYTKLDVTTIYVDDDADPSWYDSTHVKTIQEGIDNASTGDSVFVYNGEYYGDLFINKTINLNGENKHHTKNTGIFFFYNVNGGNISNFNMTDDGEVISGVELWSTDDVNIFNNIIENGDGISVFCDCDNNNIYDNYLKNNDYGIRIGGEGCNTSSNNNIVSNNILIDNYFGLFIENSYNNLIYNNYFENSNNVFENEYNKYNISKTSSTNIIGGPYLGGNYWNDYNGTDFDEDGLGDTPYSILGYSENSDYLPLMYTYSNNTPPVAENDSYSVQENNVLFVDVEDGVLFNDNDIDEDLLIAEKVSDPPDGLLEFWDNGSFVYTPNPGFSGIDSFSYRAFDGEDYSNIATVAIIVTSNNTPPVAYNDLYNTQENEILYVTILDSVLNNDIDIDNDFLTALKITNPSNGIIIFYSLGAFIYTPNPNYSGTDSFTYKAYDGLSYSDLATVTITIESNNTPPIAQNDTYLVQQNNVLFVDAGNGVLNNDIDDDILTAEKITEPTDGILEFLDNGSFVYTPNPDFNGTDSFTYKAFDGEVYSNIATVTITILSSNNTPPIAENDNYTVFKNNILNVNIADGVLKNDFDADFDNLTAIEGGNGPYNGTLLFWSNGSFIYTPDPGFSGVDSFDYWSYDGIDVSNIAIVTIDVTTINDSIPPSKVEGLTVNDAKNGKLDLSWNQSTDNMGIAYYRIYCDNLPAKNTTNNSTSYRYKGLTNGITYTFNVSAVDIAGNEGEQSDNKSGTPTETTGGGGGDGGVTPTENINPVAKISEIETNRFVGEQIIFDGTQSYDEDGTIISYQWDFDDGTTSTGNIVSHSYQNVGTYVVKLTVTDNDNGKDIDDISMIISTANYPPSKPTITGPTTGHKNIEYEFTTQSYDPDNDQIRYVFNWGDQEISSTEFIQNGTPVIQLHVWKQYGEYPISVKAYDNVSESDSN